MTISSPRRVSPITPCRLVGSAGNLGGGERLPPSPRPTTPPSLLPPRPQGDSASQPENYNRQRRKHHPRTSTPTRAPSATHPPAPDAPPPQDAARAPRPSTRASAATLASNPQAPTDTPRNPRRERSASPFFRAGELAVVHRHNDFRFVGMCLHALTSNSFMAMRARNNRERTVFTGSFSSSAISS